ncbi:hypothetical protein [Streptomyces griseus]|uniref:hypothetical protein n=1 Tax=Streptomyces griseus TaxID=1911 RepID=UPI003696FFDC
MPAGARLAGELPDLIETATGIARQLHNTLLDARNEERATLLDDQNHPKVHALYQSWGWTTLGAGPLSGTYAPTSRTPRSSTPCCSTFP